MERFGTRVRQGVLAAAICLGVVGPAAAEEAAPDRDRAYLDTVARLLTGDIEGFDPVALRRDYVATRFYRGCSRLRGAAAETPQDEVTMLVMQDFPLVETQFEAMDRHRRDTVDPGVMRDLHRLFAIGFVEAILSQRFEVDGIEGYPVLSIPEQHIVMQILDFEPGRQELTFAGDRILDAWTSAVGARTIVFDFGALFRLDGRC